MKSGLPTNANIATRESINTLPASSGVYYFIDQKDDVIYVGKSVNLLQRVKSHFSAAKRIEKERKLALHTSQLQWQTTPGELSALLLESYEIKRLQPIYNRRLRRRFKQYAWRLDEVDGVLKPKLDDAIWPPIADKNQAQYGAYKSVSHAQKALMSLLKRYHLCAKLLGFESSGNSCFGYQLKQCRGACVGDESLESHNQRVRAAFANNLLDEWPFKNVVGVVESASPSEVILFDRWQYLGTHDRQRLSDLSEIVSEHEHSNTALIEFARAQAAHELDRDSYKILLSFLINQNEGIEILDYSYV